MSASGSSKTTCLFRTTGPSETLPQSIDPAMATPEAARYLGYSSAELRKRRRGGRGPRFIRHMRSVRYKFSDLQAWEAAHAIEPAKETAP